MNKPLPDVTDLTVRELRRWLNDRRSIVRARQIEAEGDQALSAALLEEVSDIRAMSKSLKQLCGYVVDGGLPISSLEECLKRGDAPQGATELVAMVSTLDQVFWLQDGDNTDCDDV